ATFSTPTKPAGPSVAGCDPNSAGPTSSLVRLAGTGAGPVTSMRPVEIVVFLLAAPTPITLGELAGEMLVASSGPALPLANTMTTPASTAASAACTIGSGQASVFWYDAPHELLMTSAPSAAASSIACTSSAT